MCVHNSDSPVCFAQSSSLEASPGSLVFYDVVDCDVVSRCSVLSCIAEAGGKARLPEAVTISDFRIWLTAVPPGPKTNDLTSLCLRTMCAAAKVADAIDDPLLGRWIQLIAEYLSQRLSHRLRPLDEMDYGPDRDARVLKAIGCFLELPDHIQCQVYKAVATEPWSDPPTAGPELHKLLALVPRCLHTSIVAAVVHPDTAVRVALSPNSNSILDALASLPASPQQLLSLEVGGEPDSRWSRSTQQPAQLATVLRRHSGISSLSLGVFCDRSAMLQTLAPALSTLTALKSLRLGARNPHDRATKVHIPHEQQPSEAQIRMLILEARDDTALIIPAKRRRCDPDQRQYCLASTLSAASALTSLHIYDVADAIGVNSTLKLPMLVDLSIEVHRCQQATRFLSHLDAPLTTLTLAEATYSRSPEVIIFDIAAFVLQVSRFKHVRRLRVPDASVRTWPGWAVAMMLHSTCPELMALLQLHTLDFQPDACMLEFASQKLSSAAPALRCLSLLAFDSSGNSRDKWQGVIHRLSQLPLQELALSLDSAGPRLADLLPLTCLTSLQLDGYDLAPGAGSALNAAAEDLAAFGKMTQLRSLRLGRACRTPDICGAALMRHLAALPLLASLVIEDTGVDFAFAGAVMDVTSPWPALRRLSVSVTDPRGVVTELVHAVGSLPAFEELDLIFNPNSRSLFDVESLECDADDDTDCEEAAKARLRCIARQMGVALSCRSIHRSCPPRVVL